MKKITRRTFLGLMGATAAATCFTGCSEEEQVGITWSNWVGSEDASMATIQSMIDGYNATAGDMDQVEQINWPWGDTETQLALRAQGKDQYDVAQIDIKMLPSLALAGVLADLEPIFGADFFADNFPAGSVEVGKYGGVQYGVPWTIAPMAMIANPTILAEAGVDFDIETLEDFEKACELVKNNHPANLDSDQSNEIIPYAAMTKDDSTVGPDYQVWMWTFGASMYDADGNASLDSQEAIDCLTWFTSMHDKGYMQDAMTRGDARTLFKEGRIAFYDDALAAKSSIYEEAVNGAIEDHALPMLRPVLTAGDTPQAQSWGHLLVLIDRSVKHEVGKEFIEYLISDEVALTYLENCGTLPSTNTGLAADAVMADYWMEKWTPILANGRLPENCGVNYSATNQVMLENIQAALSGSKTVQQASDDMQAGVANV